MFTSLELCAGAGGQALGLEQAGFSHLGLVEIDRHCCDTLRLNRPAWNVIEDDLREFKNRADSFKGVDVIAGGLPCPPFSIAGKQLGEHDERNLFPDMVDVVDAARPKAVMIENVRGLLSAIFEDYRESLKTQLKKLGYITSWRLLNASNFGVPQLRPRVVIAAINSKYAEAFDWPKESSQNPPTVGEAIYDLMAERGWLGARDWRDRADEVAPTIVGGSMKHGGPDLGPTRAKKAWATIGVNAHTVANEAPESNFVGMPRLTVRMIARLQGFPDDWQFSGKKTPAYRQVGNAFPPPVARAVALQIATALSRNAIIKSVA